jgi:excisionase family DNA binding protein
MARVKTRYDISELKTVNEASKVSGVPLRTVYNWLKLGAIQPIMFGGRALLDAATVGKLQNLRQGHKVQ